MLAAVAAAILAKKMMWLLYLLIGFVVTGILSVLLTVKNVFILDLLQKNGNLYMLYHIVLSFYSTLLGPFGTELRQKSFVRVLDSENVVYGPAIKKLKDKLFADLKTSTSKLRILEAGVGPGVNFDYYPKSCDLTIVEPVEEFQESVRNALLPYDGIYLERYLQIEAEDMGPIDDNSMDVVITSDLLCSVSDPCKVLTEIRRVLKPGGKYYFSEHTLDQPGTFRRCLQDILSWTNLWTTWMMGCKFIAIPPLFSSSGFFKVQATCTNLLLDQFVASVELIAPHYYGVATK